MSTRYNTGNPIESTDVRDMSDNAKSLDLFSNSSELSFDDRLGIERKTIHGMNSEFDGMIVGMNSEFDAQILNMGFTRVGTFATGATLTNPRQTLLWDIADGGDGQEYGWSGAFSKAVPPLSDPNITGGIAVGGWISRFDQELRTQVRESLRRSYAEAGYNLVTGSFEAGGTLVNANDVLLYEAKGEAYSYLGIIPSGGYDVAPGTNPVSDTNWKPVTDDVLRVDLSKIDGANLVGSATYSQIRAYTGTATKINCIGRANVFDNGHGTFQLDAADTTTADNDGTVLVDATGRRWKRQFVGDVMMDWFGAKGDGVNNDSAALFSAIANTPSGGTLRARDGIATYLVKQTFVITKPIVIKGGAKEQTTFLFATDGTYLAAPYKAGFIFIHSTTVVPGYSGDSRRSRLIGMTVKGQSKIAGMRGIQIHVPIYIDSVDATNFGSDGIGVIASNGTIAGNANGCSLKDSYAFGNGGSGFYFHGDDANACLTLGCRAFGNAGYGFYDDSLLGNAYVGDETDANTGGGYFATSLKPNRSAYYGCYSEGNQTPTWDISPRCVRMGGLGSYEHNRAHDGVVLGGIPAGDAYLNKGLTFASTEDIANAGGTGAFPGPYSKVDYTGWTYRQGATTAIIKFNGNASGNYTDWLVDDVPVIRFPNGAVTGNLTKNKPYYPNGLSLGSSGRSAIVGAGTAAPTTGTYDAGAIFLNDLPSAGGFIGWVCVTAGTPGVWKTFGAISA